MDKYRLLFSFSGVLFLLCFAMCFIVGVHTAEFVIMLISVIINLFLIIYAVYRIRKNNEDGNKS